MAQHIRLLSGEKQPGESHKAVQACNDWLREGRGRSLRALCDKYRDSQGNTENRPPTRSYNTLQMWSKRFGWKERAEVYDAELEQQKNERRKQVMSEGLALDFERTDQLKQLAHFLIEQINEQVEVKDEAGNVQSVKRPNVWVRDVKQIGSGEQAEKVEIERFNAAIISELRGVLDDLAKETGGRVQKQDISGSLPLKLIVLPAKDDGGDQ